MSVSLPPGAHVFRCLAGRWRLARDIPGIGAMQGSAAFKGQADGSLAYLEEGVMVWAGIENEVHRRFTYAIEGDRVIIRFADGADAGKPYAGLAFEARDDGSYRAQDVYLCGQDRYRTRFTLSAPDRFETDILVSGPRKDYRLLSVYERME